MYTEDQAVVFVIENGGRTPHEYLKLEHSKPRVVHARNCRNGRQNRDKSLCLVVPWYVESCVEL